MKNNTVLPFSVALAVSTSLIGSVQAGIQPSGSSESEIAHGAAAEVSIHETNPYADAGPVAGGRGGHGHGAGSNGISYHGGPVMSGITVTAYLIWYGSWSGNTAMTIIPAFLNNLAPSSSSSYYNINTTYYDGGGTHVVNSVRLGTQTSTPSSTYGTSLSDADIQNIVSNAITSKRLPSDVNGVYFVLTSADVTASSGFCTQYCGWHTYGTINGSNIKYAFVGNPDRCISSCAAQSTSPNGNAGADGMVSIIAHELEEAVTDPNLNAWYDFRGYENADKCAWTFGTTYTDSNGAKYNVTLGGKNYLIQRNWVNASGGYCSMSY
jgi:hypothetical protein